MAGMVTPGMVPPGMVIVGAGETGARAAASLREQGWDGAVTLIGAERHLPYERPPLSKAALLSADEPLPATILAAAALESSGIAHLASCPAVAIDRAARQVLLADGTCVPYQRLLLATGARPRALPIPGADGPDVLMLRTFDDAMALRRRLGPGTRLVVIGGGFIGLELAASALTRGAAVTVLEAAPRLLTRGVPPALAAMVEARHRAAGVEIRAGVSIAAIEHIDGSTAVRLGDGARIPADLVAVGIGAVPETALAEAAGLAVENGIRVDATLHTDDPAILAAGDCCSFPHPLYGGRRIRLEAWRNAQDQGTTAARNMLGVGVAHDAVPWFWSDQYDRTLQIAGLPDAGSRIVERVVGPEARLVFHLDDDGRLVAAGGFGTLGEVARDIRVAEMLIARRARPDPAALGSPDVRLKSLLAAA